MDVRAVESIRGQRGEKGPLASLTNKQCYVWSQWWQLLCQFQQWHLVCSFNALWHDYFQHFNISFSAHWTGQYFNISYFFHSTLGWAIFQYFFHSTLSIFQYFNISIFVSQHTGLGKYQRRPVRTGEAGTGGYLLQKLSRLPCFDFCRNICASIFSRISAIENSSSALILDCACRPKCSLSSSWWRWHSPGKVPPIILLFVITFTLQ